MYKKANISMIIPALNEALSLADVLKSIPTYVDKVIVVDNGSSDNTFAIAAAGNHHPNVIACREVKRGYGNACLKGMEQLTVAEIVVFMDADGSDFPEELPRLLDPLLDGPCQVAISNRFTKYLEPGAMSLPQRMGSKLAVFLVKLLWNFSYHDLGPFRAIYRQSLQKLQMQDRNFGWTIELQIKAIEHNLRICQVDVPYRKRLRGYSKVGSNLRGVVYAGLKIIFCIFYYKLRKLFSC